MNQKFSIKKIFSEYGGLILYGVIILVVIIYSVFGEKAKTNDETSSIAIESNDTSSDENIEEDEITEEEAEKELSGTYNMEVCKTTVEDEPCYFADVRLIAGEPQWIRFTRTGSVDLQSCSDNAPSYDCWDFYGHNWSIEVPSYYYFEHLYNVTHETAEEMLGMPIPGPVNY